MEVSMIKILLVKKPIYYKCDNHNIHFLTSQRTINMKHLFSLVLASLLGLSSLHAEEKAATMQTLLDAVSLIQLGFLTNTKVLVERGVVEIKMGKGVLEEVDHSSYLTLDKLQAHKYTSEVTKKIGKHADDLLEAYNNNDIPKALNEYGLITQQCVNCHEKLRDYKDISSPKR